MRFSRWFTFVPVLLLVLFIPISRVKADALGNWTYSQSCVTSGSVEVVDDAIILHGPDGGGCQGANWVKIESVIPEGVDTVDFTWAYQTNDGAWYDPPQYAVNGQYIQLTNANNATGSLSVPVVEGDVFTFRQYSTDTCCQPGNLTISDLSLWTAAQTTTTTSTLETTTTEAPTTTSASSTSFLQQTTTTESTTTTTQPPETTTSIYLPSTTVQPQTTTTETQTTSSTSSSTSSTYQIDTTTTLLETTTISVTPTTIPTISPTPPTTVYIPTGTTTTIVEEPLEMPQPQDGLPSTTKTPVVDNPSPQTTDTVIIEPITNSKVDAIINDALAPGASAEEVVTAIDSILTNDVTVGQLKTVVDAVFTADANTEVMVAALNSLVSADLSVRELATVLENVFDADLSDEATIELAKQILDQPLSTEEFKTVLNAIFDERISDEVLVETFTAVLDTPLTQERFAEVVNVLSSDAITNEQVAQVVDLVIGQEGGVPAEQAVELVSSAKVLESVSGDQATEVFGAVDEGSLTLENGEQITAAVQQAPVEVRNAFQEEINVFGGVFDGYYPLGSMVDVGTRRVVIAGTGVLIFAPVVVSRRVRV